MRVFSGQAAWLVQRFSALVLLVLLALSLTVMLVRPPGFDAWRSLVGSSHGAVLIVVGFIALGLHGWVGARDIVLDYVHAAWLRLTLLALIAVLLTGVLMRVVLIVASIFGRAN